MSKIITFKQAIDLLSESAAVLHGQNNTIYEFVLWDKSEATSADLEDPEEQDWRQYKFAINNGEHDESYFFLDMENEAIEVSENSMTLTDKEGVSHTIHPLFKRDLEDMVSVGL